MTTATRSSDNKVVSFRDEAELCTYHDGAILDIDGVRQNELWFQYIELQHIKRKAMLLSKEASRYGLGSLLTNTYGRTDNDTQEALITWARNCSGRRGLERFINKEYAAKRYDIRARTNKSVMTAQRKMIEDGIVDKNYMEKVLSRLSEAFSKDSRYFAIGMGIADERTARAIINTANTTNNNNNNNNNTPYQPKQTIHKPSSLVSVMEYNHTNTTSGVGALLQISSSSSSISNSSTHSSIVQQQQQQRVLLDTTRCANEMRHYY